MNPVLKTLADQVTRTTTVEDSARRLIDGFAQRLQDAIAAALANGATAEELQPVQDEADALAGSSAALAAAVEENTAPPAAASKKKP
jgi:Mg2+ and Co2+ transporter CorA